MAKPLGTITTIPTVLAKPCRAGAFLLAATLLAACSTAPEWARPAVIYGGGSAAAATAEPGGVSEFPKLVDVPERRAPSLNAAERAQVRQELAAERERALQADDNLRRGDAKVTQPFESDAGTPGPGAALKADEGRTARAAVPAFSGRKPTRAELAAIAARAAAKVAAKGKRPADATPKLALAETPVSGTAPAPAEPGPTVSPEGFAASTAPVLVTAALDAVGPVIAARYRSTHQLPLAPPARTAVYVPPVTINLAALEYLQPDGPEPPPNAIALTPPPAAPIPPEFASQGGPGGAPPYTVHFDHGSTTLAKDAQAMLAQAALAQQEHGGTLRVVGHSSSRTGDLPVAEHRLVNFRVSLNRANSVANELIRQGADPARVVVEAKGDAEPIYFESMPAGEAGNRRAEIFLELPPTDGA